MDSPSCEAEGNAITVLTTNYVDHSQMLYVWKLDGLMGGGVGEMPEVFCFLFFFFGGGKF